MQHPAQSTPAHHSPGIQPKDHVHDGHPKVEKYDELRYGHTYAPAQIPATDRLKRFFRTDDSSFWTGILIGGAVTFFLTSDTVKRAIVKSFAKVSEEAKKEVKKVKKAVVKEKEGEKAEKK